MKKAESFIDYLKEFNTLSFDGQPTATLAVVRSYSCEMLEQVLGVIANRRKMPCKLSFGGYGQYHQELIDPGSFLYTSSFDALLVAVRLEDICPALERNFYEYAGQTDALVEQVLQDMRDLLTSFASRKSTPILVCNFVLPFYAPDASYHSQKDGLRTVIRKLNAGLAELTGSMQNAYIVDLERAIYEIGAVHAYDRKMMRLARNPYSVDTYAALANQVADLLAAIRGKRKKCIIVDCDNTLWKGIVGEDGVFGIKIDEDFQEMHRQLLYWKSTGVLLAACSKNNMADVEEVFEKNPDMLLALADFAAMRVNWTDKAENIRQIARELNIGEDSFIFVDDSEFECNLVREVLPGVEVVHLDGNSRLYPEIIRSLPGLNFARLTEEDTRRAAMYTEQKQREELKAGSSDLTSYLEGLGMRLEFSLVNEASLARAAQLTQKTNQFNLTTLRYTEDDLIRMQKEGAVIIILRVQDRFGDNGWTGLAIIDTKDALSWEIDTFLLSCRVMGRTVEQAFFAMLLDMARQKGVRELVGRFIPTAKNKPVEYFYRDLGFREESDGTWHYAVADTYPMPGYFQYVFLE